jgi:hypothetical protein
MTTAPPTSPLPFAATIPPELDADTNAILEKLASGTPLDADTYNRVRQQADRIRDEVFRKHGLLDIGVSAVREFRDGE